MNKGELFLKKSINYIGRRRKSFKTVMQVFMRKQYDMGAYFLKRQASFHCQDLTKSAL